MLSFYQINYRMVCGKKKLTLGRCNRHIDETTFVCFFQLVWKDSVKVGLATAISPQYGTIIVARYHPRGNIGFLDDYVRNVAPKGETYARVLTHPHAY